MLALNPLPKFLVLPALVAALALLIPAAWCAEPAGHGEKHPPQTQSGPEKGNSHGHDDGSDDATVRHPFHGADRWAQFFDHPDRDRWQMPSEVVTALGLKPGMTVADIGAGTGYFNRFLAEAVGPSGRVLALDTEPEMVEHMKSRAEKEGTPNVRPLLVEPSDPKLPAGGVDVVMIVNTYHHIDDRLDYFRRMKKALKPGGRVAVIDYLKKPLPVGPREEHKISREHITGEMRTAGYRLAGEPEFLPYQYFLIFTPADG